MIHFFTGRLLNDRYFVCLSNKSLLHLWVESSLRLPVYINAILCHQALTSSSTMAATTVPAYPAWTLSATNVVAVGVDRPLLDLRFTKLS